MTGVGHVFGELEDGETVDCDAASSVDQPPIRRGLHGGLPGAGRETRTEPLRLARALSSRRADPNRISSPWRRSYSDEVPVSLLASWASSASSNLSPSRCRHTCRRDLPRERLVGGGDRVSRAATRARAAPPAAVVSRHDSPGGDPPGERG
jgi:hypothetical protein